MPNERGQEQRTGTQGQQQSPLEILISLRSRRAYVIWNARCSKGWSLHRRIWQFWHLAPDSAPFSTFFAAGLRKELEEGNTGKQRMTKATLLPRAHVSRISLARPSGLGLRCILLMLDAITEHRTLSSRMAGRCKISEWASAEVTARLSATHQPSHKLSQALMLALKVMAFAASLTEIIFCISSRATPLANLLTGTGARVEVDLIVATPHFGHCGEPANCPMVEATSGYNFGHFSRDIISAAIFCMHGHLQSAISRIGKSLNTKKLSKKDLRSHWLIAGGQKNWQGCNHYNMDPGRDHVGAAIRKSPTFNPHSSQFQHCRPGVEDLSRWVNCSLQPIQLKGESWITFFFAASG